MSPVQSKSSESRTPPARGGLDGDIWMGDVVHAWHELGVTSRAERSAIAALLGFHLKAEVEVDPASQSASPSHARERPLSRHGVRAETIDVDPVPRTTPAAVGPVVVPLAPPSEVAGSTAGSEPAWRIEAIPLDAERPEHMTFAPVPEPLFDTRWTRAIVGAICATRSPDGPVDMDALVERVARSEVITRLPRERVVTVRRGVQLLVDHGQSMMPFMRDVDQISQRIVDVAGHDRTQLWHFSVFPEDGAGPGGPSTWRRPYVPPPPGTPVVLISDLGHARGAPTRDGAPPEAWLNFGAKLARSGCPAIAIVPLPVERLRSMSSAFRILSWDRRTAVSHARRAAAGEPVR